VDRQKAPVIDKYCSIVTHGFRLTANLPSLDLSQPMTTELYTFANLIVIKVSLIIKCAVNVVSGGCHCGQIIYRIKCMDTNFKISTWL
jgi:hypothetical protein